MCLVMASYIKNILWPKAQEAQEAQEAPPAPPSSPAKQGNGSMLALASYGQQDRWMQGLPPEAFDARHMFLKNRHNVTYKRLDTNNVNRAATNIMGRSIVMTLLRECDLVSCIDLYIDNPGAKPLFDIVKSITTEYGGQRMERLCFQEQYDMSCVLFNRKPTHMNGKSVFPLPMAPVHQNNLVMPSAQHHNFVVIVEFVDSPVEVSLYGKAYYLDNPDRAPLFDNRHEFTTVQSIAIDCGKLRKGNNTIKLNYFNHPVYMLYFWGFDKSKVTNVRFEINECPIYDGPIEPLEHYKASRGHGHCAPLVIYFSEDKLNVLPRSSLNFSRIDRVVLNIETNQEEESDVYAGAFNIQGFRYMNGMVGLSFSK